MPEPLFDLDDDANTPLTDEERDGLIPSYITLRHERFGSAFRVSSAIFTPEISDNRPLRGVRQTSLMPGRLVPNTSRLSEPPTTTISDRCCFLPAPKERHPA
jgi:hypothetical protein